MIPKANLVWDGWINQVSKHATIWASITYLPLLLPAFPNICLVTKTHSSLSHTLRRLGLDSQRGHLVVIIEIQSLADRRLTLK